MRIADRIYDILLFAIIIKTVQLRFPIAQYKNTQSKHFAAN